MACYDDDVDLENATSNGETDTTSSNPWKMPICLFPCVVGSVFGCTAWGFIIVLLSVVGILLGILLSPWFFLMIGPFVLTPVVCDICVILIMLSFAVVFMIYRFKRSVGDDD